MVRRCVKDGGGQLCEEVYKYECEWKESSRPSEENMGCVAERPS